MVSPEQPSAMLRSYERYAYSAISKRPAYDWPGGYRLAVYVGLNLEHFAFGEGLGAQLAPGGAQPDILNFAWRDNGNRVGVWRMIDCFEAPGFPVSVLANAAIYDYCPEVMEAFRRRGDEIVGHGRTNSERQGDLEEHDEARLIRETTEAITSAEGTAPRGWLGPWISESAATPDLLQAAGYGYLLDWCADDQPMGLQCRRGRILAVPYPEEVNDIPAIVARRMGTADVAAMIVDRFDEMVEQSAERPFAHPQDRRRFPLAQLP